MEPYDTYKHNFGVIPSPADDRDFVVTAIAPPVKLPDSVRMDDRILKIRHQGFCGTCVSKAGATVLSAGHRKQVSSLYLYARCKAIDGIPNIEGTYPRVALKVMKNEGSCLEELLPYTELKACGVMPKLTDAMQASAARYKIKAYARTWTLEEIQQVLAAGHLVMITTWVGDSFLNYKGGGNIKPTYRERRRGLHESVLCGYENKIGAFRGANSWGEKNWGDHGFYWMDFSCFGKDGDYQEGWGVEVVKRALSRPGDKRWA